MKRLSAVWLVASGMLLGVAATLLTGAAGAPAEPPKPDFSHVQVVTYVNGETGFFDPQTGRLFVYDTSGLNCYAIREMTGLGMPMRRLR
jgi:hypothetical protein